MRGRAHASWSAINRHSFKVAAGHFKRSRRRGGKIKLNIVGYKQIQQAIAVVVDKRAAGAEARFRVKQSGFLSHFGKGAIAVIAIQLVLPVISYEDIFKAVVVIVADADAASPSAISQPGLLGHVGKRTVAVVLVEPVGGIGRGVLYPSPAEDEDIHPSVVVVVKESAASAHALHNVIHPVRSPIVHGRNQSSAAAYIHKF